MRNVTSAETSLMLRGMWQAWNFNYGGQVGRHCIHGLITVFCLLIPVRIHNITLQPHR